jgi:ribosomal protein L7Ae-like RNA K-turn-binding protein
VRAGKVVLGTAGVQAGLKRGEIVLVVLASDYSRRSAEKIGRLALARGIPVLLGPEARELGRRLGRAPLQAAGVRDRDLAAGIGSGGESEEG